MLTFYHAKYIFALVIRGKWKGNIIGEIILKLN